MTTKDRWRSHPVLGAMVSAVAMLAPFGASVAAAALVGGALPRGHAPAARVVWWGVVLASSTLAFFASERFFRRLWPLAALLKMTMLFPDQAPKRLKVAWRAGLTRDLERSSKGHGPAKPSVPAAVAEEILALAASISRHDRRTRGHSERVRAFTDLIADELHLPTADRDRLRWSALLHDVGKLSVHPDILNKAGKPTEQEWAEIRNHPLEGRRLVAPLVPWLGEWGLAIEQHHESFDGSGYPFGLSGDGISRAARIVAVADAFEVMTAVRSYKKPLSPVAARKELTRCAGGQFDPVIVRALLNVSIGRLRWVIGPVSWVTDVPFLARLSVAGHALMASTQVVVGAAALTAGSALAIQAASPPPPLVTTRTSLAVAAAPETTTTLPPRSIGPVTPAPAETTTVVVTSTTAALRAERPDLSHGRRGHVKSRPVTKPRPVRPRAPVSPTPPLSTTSTSAAKPRVEAEEVPPATATTAGPASPPPSKPAPAPSTTTAQGHAPLARPYASTTTSRPTTSTSGPPPPTTARARSPISTVRSSPTTAAERKSVPPSAPAPPTVDPTTIAATTQVATSAPAPPPATTTTTSVAAMTTTTEAKTTTSTNATTTTLKPGLSTTTTENPTSTTEKATTTTAAATTTTARATTTTTATQAGTTTTAPSPTTTVATTSTTEPTTVTTTATTVPPASTTTSQPAATTTTAPPANPTTTVDTLCVLDLLCL